MTFTNQASKTAEVDFPKPFNSPPDFDYTMGQAHSATRGPRTETKEIPMPRPSPISRRNFIQTSSITAATVGASALTTLAAIGANDRINFGVIGNGSQGTYHVNSLVGREKRENVKLIAVSDVYNKRLENAKSICGGEGHNDYRKLLDNKDVDAVVVATPDHWHAKIAIDAMQAGKHVYVEKPMTHTIDQAFAVKDTAERLNKIVQVGPQGTSDGTWWMAHELIKQGLIGKVIWSQASYSRNSRGGEWNYGIHEEAGPNASGPHHIDWDTWLGHQYGLAPNRDWSPERFFRFRKYWDYSGGIATDLLYHVLAPLLIAISGRNGEFPQRVAAGGGIWVQKDREVPDTFFVTIDYPSEHTIQLGASMANDNGLPAVIRGHHATMTFQGGKILLDEQKPFKDEFREKAKDKDGFKIDNDHASLLVDREARPEHMQAFILAMRGQDTLNCNAALGVATQVAITMSILAYRMNKTLTFDVARRRIMEA